jgi:flagellar biosynthesis/type III secretory pathway protein FliH
MQESGGIRNAGKKTPRTERSGLMRQEDVLKRAVAGGHVVPSEVETETMGIKEQIRLDLEAARTEARTEGKAEGMAEGMEKEKLEIARNLKKMGLPASQIAEGTGLLPEVIEEL